MKFEELKSLHHQYKIRYFSGLIISLVLSIGLSFLITPYLAIFFFIICLIFAQFFSAKKAAAFNKAYKAYFVSSTFAKTFTDLQYDHTKGLSRDYVRTAGLLNTGDRFSSNDFTLAKYKDTKFVQADVNVEEMHTDSEGHVSYVTIFRGRYLVYEFERDFNFNLMLFGKRFYAAGNGGLFRKNRKYEKVKTESNEFNKRFKIYAQDGFETFYLLDPAFIERLQQLYDFYKGRIAVGFMDKKLHIAIDNKKDSFEAPSPFKKLNEKAEFDKVLAETKIITDFVDTLKLDKNIFKK